MQAQRGSRALGAGGLLHRLRKRVELRLPVAQAPFIDATEERQVLESSEGITLQQTEERVLQARQQQAQEDTKGTDDDNLRRRRCGAVSPWQPRVAQPLAQEKQRRQYWRDKSNEELPAEDRAEIRKCHGMNLGQERPRRT